VILGESLTLNLSRIQDPVASKQLERGVAVLHAVKKLAFPQTGE
jgi:hypothetical protein